MIKPENDRKAADEHIFDSTQAPVQGPPYIDAAGITLRNLSHR